MKRASVLAIAAVVTMLQATAMAASWTTINLIDKWGENDGYGAVSAPAKPSEPMSFPYGAVSGWIMVKCDIVWLRFDESPILTGGTLEDGYRDHVLAARIDGNDVDLEIRQWWGSKDLYVTTSNFRTRLSQGKRLDVLLPWYGQGYVRFTWSLRGSSATIKALNC